MYVDCAFLFLLLTGTGGILAAMLQGEDNFSGPRQPRSHDLIAFPPLRQLAVSHIMSRVRIFCGTHDVDCQIDPNDAPIVWLRHVDQ